MHVRIPFVYCEYLQTVNIFKLSNYGKNSDDAIATIQYGDFKKSLFNKLNGMK